jgi:hypothetical protein
MISFFPLKFLIYKYELKYINVNNLTIFLFIFFVYNFLEKYRVV